MRYALNRNTELIAVVRQDGLSKAALYRDMSASLASASLR